MFSYYGQEVPKQFTSRQQLENFVRTQLYDSGLTHSMVDKVFPTAMVRVLSIGAIQDLQRRKFKGLGNFGFSISDLSPQNIVKQISRTVEEVKKVVPENIAHSATQATAALKPIGDLYGNAVAELGRVGQGVKESVQDIYAENFGAKNEAHIPTNDELIKAGDVDANGFILTNKINRLLPVGISLNIIAQNQAMMGFTQWHEMNYQINHLLPWLINNSWISFDVKNQKWNMPFRSRVGQMNGTGRVGSGDFYIDIYGYHNLNDEAMLGTITSFAPIFGYTDKMKADLTNTINMIADSVQRKSGREWNRNATKIAATVIAIVAVAVFVGPAVLGAVQGAVAAGAGMIGVAVPTTGLTATAVAAGESYLAKEALTPVTDPVTKQLVDGTIGAVSPKSIMLPDNDLNFDLVMKSIQLNPNLTPQQKANATVVIDNNKVLQVQTKKSTLAKVGVVGAGVIGVLLLL